LKELNIELERTEFYNQVEIKLEALDRDRLLEKYDQSISGNK
jgi:hypothetical protein